MIPWRITSNVIGSIEAFSETILSALAILLLYSFLLASHNDCNAQRLNFGVLPGRNPLSKRMQLVFENFVEVFRTVKQFAPSFILPRRAGESERGLSGKIAGCGSMKRD